MFADTEAHPTVLWTSFLESAQADRSWADRPSQQEGPFSRKLLLPPSSSTPIAAVGEETLLPSMSQMDGLRGRDAFKVRAEGLGGLGPHDSLPQMYLPQSALHPPPIAQPTMESIWPVLRAP